MRLQKCANVSQLATQIIRYNYYNQRLFLVKQMARSNLYVQANR